MNITMISQNHTHEHCKDIDQEVGEDSPDPGILLFAGWNET
jgi:hypothetical protein